MKKKRKNSKQFNQRFKKRFFTKKSVTVMFFALIILIGIGFGCQRQKKTAEKYQKTIEELNTDIQELEETNKTLEEEKENMDSDAFKEKMARERLNMIGKDEYSLQRSEEEASTESGASKDEPQKEESSARNRQTKKPQSSTKRDKQEKDAEK